MVKDIYYTQKVIHFQLVGVMFVKEKEKLKEKRLYYDSKNPHSKTLPHKLDFFVFICLDKIEYDMYSDLDGWIK